MPSSLGSSPYSVVPDFGQVLCAIYARFSSDNQNPATIDAQIRACRMLAARKGWLIAEGHLYKDEEKTGRTLAQRHGFQAMMARAKQPHRPFHYILVADVSRMGRNKADLFKTIDILTFQKVRVYFVEDELDSGESHFEESFHSRAQQAARFSKSLSIKVRSAREACFEKGYNPGGGCFGYTNEPDEDLTRKGLYGRPAVKGVLQVINPEEAAIVLRIFRAYATGMSLSRIATMLNTEAIPPSQQARKRDKPSWCKTAIRAMLNNPRYRGYTTWNKTTQLLDPETEKFVRRDVPEHEWLESERPDLRIVSDELWSEVQEQMKRMTRGLGVKRAGGMSRTEMSRRYLFSGLLRCGTCGGNMTITSTNPARYGCADHRNRNTCDNKTTVRVDLLESTFISALVKQLENPDLAEQTVQSLLSYLNSAHGKAIQSQLDCKKERNTHEQSLSELHIHKCNLVGAIKEMGHSRALIAELEDIEARIERVEDLLDAVVKPLATKVTEEEVRAFLANRNKSFLDLLSENPERIRLELQKRISTVVLTPSPENKKAYTASGDIGIFSQPEDAVRNNPGDLIGLHYNFPISFAIPAPQRGGKLAIAA